MNPELVKNQLASSADLVTELRHTLAMAWVDGSKMRPFLVCCQARGHCHNLGLMSFPKHHKAHWNEHL